MGEEMASQCMLLEDDLVAATEAGEDGVIRTLPKQWSKCVNLAFRLGRNPLPDLDHFPVSLASNHLDLQSVGGSSREIGIKGRGHIAQYSARQLVIFTPWRAAGTSDPTCSNSQIWRIEGCPKSGFARISTVCAISRFAYCWI